MLGHCSGYDADCFLMEPSISNEELVQLEFRNSTSAMIHNDNQVCVLKMMRLNPMFEGIH